LSIRRSEGARSGGRSGARRESMARRGASLAALACGLLLVVACRSDVPDHVVSLAAIGGPVTVGDTPYQIHPGDELEIRFFHTPDQNVILPVRPDGFISLPMAYEVRAAGRTAEELRQDLVQRYGRELQSPEIAVIVRTFSGFQVHVGGEVDKPGVLEISGTRTVLQAIFEAGGFLPSASPADTVVIRLEPDGGIQIVPVDLERLLEGKSARGNLNLRPFDVVFVPRSPIGNVNKWVDEYIRKNLPINFTISYRIDPDEL
jgi:protein involved in polysaccharide export with SLBB domain